MAPPLTRSGTLATEYCTKYPYTASLTLAKMMHAEHPKVYMSVDAARSAVRLCRGTHGSKHRIEKMNTNGLVPRFEIPPDDNQPYTHYEIHAKKTLVVADLHVPYHDASAVECALEYGYAQGCDTVLIDGDFIDFHKCSRFLQDPEARDVVDEIDSATRMLKSIKANFENVIWKEGNHDERYAHYIMQHAPQLWKIKAVRLQNVMCLEEMGVQYVSNRRVIKIGKLHVIHGHGYMQSINNPVNAARGLFLRSKGICLCAHHHHSSDHTEPTIGGDIITDWSIGCLCGLNPQYMPLNRWNHGLAIVESGSDGNFHVDNRRIYNGKIL